MHGRRGPAMSSCLVLFACILSARACGCCLCALVYEHHSTLSNACCLKLCCDHPAMHTCARPAVRQIQVFVASPARFLLTGVQAAGAWTCLSSRSASSRFHSQAPQHCPAATKSSAPACVCVWQGFLTDAMEEGLIADGTIAQDTGQAQGIWGLREGISVALRHAGA